MIKVTFTLFTLLGFAESACDPSLPCWPTQAEVDALENALDPTADRSGLLRTDPVKGGSPYPAGIPIYSQNDQALYGYEIDALKPLYYYDTALEYDCFAKSTIRNPEDREICFASVRNNGGQAPAFVAFPTTSQQVQAAVSFAKEHDLCLSVLGAGHDFLDRHSNCEFGMLIRTSLLKEMTLSSDSTNSTVKLGSGTTFSEVQDFLAPSQLYVASGWSVTVGILGWSIGGGHGPFGPSAGLGVDNIKEFEIVTADGSLLVCSAESNSDLFWAVRGGGGSTFGVITSMTLLTHSLPENGATLFQFYAASDNYCDTDTFSTNLDTYMEILPTLDERWSGLTFFTVKPTADPTKCGLEYDIFSQYIFLGLEEEAKEVVQSMASIGLANILTRKISSFNEDYVKMADPEYLCPTPLMIPSETSVGGVPSVLVPREKSADLGQAIKNRFSECSAAAGVATDGLCGRYEIYHDITGNAKDPFSADDVSITSSFRNALFHVVTGGGTHLTMNKVYDLLGDYCYQNECAFQISEESGGWKKRVFGEQYESLLEIKNKYDPEGKFWCRHCVGDETSLD
jgi:ribonuclease T2